jgi:hypothetical protein
MNSKKILLATIILSSLSCLPVIAKKGTIENLPNGTYAYTTQKQSKETRVIFRKRGKVVTGMTGEWQCFLGITKGNNIRDVATVLYSNGEFHVTLEKLRNIKLEDNPLQLNLQQELSTKARFESAGYPVEAGSSRTLGDRFNECLQDPAKLKKYSPRNTQIRKYEP